MEKIAVIWSILLMMMMMAVLPLAHGSIDQSPKAVEKWFKNLPNTKEKLTKLHFYFHDNITAENPTAIQVAGPNISQSLHPSNFGATFVVDDPLTTGPEPHSKIMGRAQGILSAASQGEIALLMALNLVFTNGKYNGSTLSLLANNGILRKYREMPIVGGTGVFRLARGIATAQTYSYNATSLNAIVEYNVLVFHY